MKKVVVLARDDANEAMRVAAGLTIFGHEVGCVLVNPAITISADNSQLELLELSEVAIVALQSNRNQSQSADMTSKEAPATFETINNGDFEAALHEADVVVSL